ncbi:S-adenosyl-L-methionine-dependent methyltransferase [Rickenella mellea]|uniref:S-adenosyl-L-methionine-dependent methyltransferase n=1 Tax=Rickenella mellea TaxID=50990 RepID=A0A4Y7PVF8_9AGAM|nr:S-adenosyl-L-methionine-dependent methyltransferase [Rickenella mellea]
MSDYSFSDRSSSFGSNEQGSPMDEDGRSTTASSLSAAPSIYSFNSERDGMALIRYIQGRAFNAQNDLYFLPADDVEFERLEKYHLVHLVSLGQLYIEPERVRRIMAPSEGEEKRVLDLGTGCGNWVAGMAQEFPHAEVVGVDLAPNTAVPLPPNARLEFDDFNLGLSHYYDSFDVVHARGVSNGVADFRQFIHEAAKCLKPGGIILIADGDHNLLNERKELQEIAFGDGGPGQSWLAREGTNALKRRGSSADERLILYEILSDCPLLEDVGEHSEFIPIGPWERGATPAEDQKRHILGILERQALIGLIKSMGPLFISEGFPSTLVNQMIDGTEKELNELTVHMYIRWRYTFGIRNGVQ